jgi:tetratricopeptide (TPR) repeat protein
MPKKIIIIMCVALMALMSLSIYPATVKGKLLNLKDEIIPQKKMALKGGDELFPKETTTDEKGEFVFENVSVGNWMIIISDEGLESIDINIKILTESETNEVDVYAWTKPDLGKKMTALWNKTLKNVKNSELEDVKKNLNTIIEKKPQFYGAYSLLGKLLYDEGKQKEGVDLLIKAVDLNPVDPQSNQLLALYYQNNKKYAQSVTYYYGLIATQPNTPEILHELADKFYVIKDYESSIQFYGTAIKYYGKSEKAALAYFYLGDSFLKSKQYKEALAPFEMFLKMAPNHQFAKDAKPIVGALKRKYGKK